MRPRTFSKTRSNEDNDEAGTQALPGSGRAVLEEVLGAAPASETKALYENLRFGQDV